MGYNKASLELMGADEDEDRIIDVLELSNGKFFVLELDALEI